MTEEKRKQGKKNRAKGGAFERLVREKLESEGWIVAKWKNQVDLEQNKLIAAKGKFNPFIGRMLLEGSGFPDFIAMRLAGENYIKQGHQLYEVIGVESKISKYLDAEEKKKADWLLINQIFSKIFIAWKPGRGKIELLKYE